jgi:hypothetical protein
VRALIAVSSVVVIAIGYMQLGKEGGLLMWVASDGTPIYPVSSGSDDRHLLAVGFLAYLLTFITAIVCSVLKRKGNAGKVSYWINLGFLALILFLVELDSSIVGSASEGDFVPLMGVAFAALPSIFLVGSLGRKALSPRH